jgi:hypothetical protein
MLQTENKYKEKAQIMNITNVFFNPISAFAQTNLIIELKLTVYSLHQNQNFFFSNIGNQNICLEKNHNPPWKLNGWSLNVLISEKFSQYDDTFSSSLCHSHYNKFINNSQFSALFVRKIVAVMTSYGF